MQNLLQLFETISQIPRCSHHGEKFYDFLIQFAEQHNYTVQTDNAKNILCYQNKRDICLQAHYDMVCVGDAPEIKLTQKENKLFANNSSLGADNGAGIAIMLFLMQKKTQAEFLFTNDEEVGLLGATHLDLSVQASKLINLDYEEEGEICIGCAGGIDIILEKTYDTKKTQYLKTYKLLAKNFHGGHSGVDIDKNIPNAIVKSAQYLQDYCVDITSIQGGEAINSIAKKCEILFCSNEIIPSNDHFEISEVAHRGDVLHSNDLLFIIANFKQGVWEHDQSLQVPSHSINFSTISQNKDSVNIKLFARFMDEKYIEILKQYIEKHFRDFKITYGPKHSPWTPKESPFAHKTLALFQTLYPHPKLCAIHAGLECGVLLEKFPHLEAISIGPTITFPHTTQETLYLDTFERCLQVVEKIIVDLK